VKEISVVTTTFKRPYRHERHRRPYGSKLRPRGKYKLCQEWNPDIANWSQSPPYWLNYLQWMKREKEVEVEVKLRLTVSRPVKVEVTLRPTVSRPVKVEVKLRPTVSRPVNLGVRYPSGTPDQFFFLHKIFFRQLRVCYFVASSLTGGRVCNLLLLLVLASTVPRDSGQCFIVPILEARPIWRARSLYLYPPGKRWPRYTPGHWVRERMLRWSQHIHNIGTTATREDAEISNRTLRNRRLWRRETEQLDTRGKSSQSTQEKVSLEKKRWWKNNIRRGNCKSEQEVLKIN
jgi:hypothetical protein